jgi:geranylgeranylglycerol-phosphate geranylgeranyltransferase
MLPKKSDFMSKGSSIIDYFRITVPYYMPIAMLGVFVGLATSGGVINYNFLLSLASVVALVAAFNTFNGVTDFKIDLINKPYRPIPSGKVSRNFALAYSEFFYIVSLFIAYQLTLQFFQIMLLSSIVTIFYSLPVISLRKRFLISNLSGAILYGVLCPLAGWALMPTNPIPFFILGFTFLFSLSLSMSKDFEDFIGDRVYKIKTIPVVLGVGKAKILSTLMLSLSFAYLIALAALGLIKIQYLLAIITLPAFVMLIRRMYKYHQSFYNSIEDRKFARRIFLMLMGLATLVEFSIGIIAIIF